MHSYGLDSNERKRVIVVLLGVSAGIAYLIHVVVEAASLSRWWWLDIPSVLGVFALAYALFDRVLWRHRRMHQLRLVSTPDLNGTWSGTATPGGEIELAQPRSVSVTIQQSWTELQVRLETEDSASRSLSGSFVVSNGRPELLYEYLNEPKPHAPSAMQIHRGHARLELAEDRSSLSGQYFTGRGRQTFGTLVLQRTGTA